MADNFTCIDLFCGAGGLTEGFRKAGFTSAFAVDCDEQAVETFRYNHRDTVCLLRDVRSLSGREILHAASLTPGDVDVLCGGPPCSASDVTVAPSQSRLVFSPCSRAPPPGPHL